MRKSFLTSIFLAACLTPSSPEEFTQRGRPIPPGIREAEKQSNKPLDPPLAPGSVVPDPLQLKHEAEELAQLSAGIPPRVDLVVQGRLPKDLSDQLKHIEKLAKHLRSEIAP
jgi:hypothetical protein